MRVYDHMAKSCAANPAIALWLQSDALVGRVAEFGSLGEQVMPPTDDQLATAFDKAMKEGPENLVGTDRDYYLIQNFVLEWENGALTGYLYNRIPDFDLVRATMDSMQRHGLTELATILGEAVKLFEGYQDSNPPTTWRAVLERYDPTGTLARLDERIHRLQDYGLTQ